jgi:nitroreductase
MEFRDVVRHRRMVRRFDQRPVPRDVIDRIIDIGRRAPSAGFSQGLELLVLDTPETVASFWETTRDPEFGWESETVAHGPTVLILPLPDPKRYLERYAQPDKIEFGMDEEANWPVRFWEIDAAMASMLMLLAAVDEGLGGWFFGITYGERGLLDGFGVPTHLRPIGILGIGHLAEDEEPSGSWMKRRRRPLDEQIHRNGW